jgi:hypothetical protein
MNSGSQSVTPQPMTAKTIAGDLGSTKLCSCNFRAYKIMYFMCGVINESKNNSH